MSPSSKKRGASEISGSGSKGYKDAQGNKINPITGVAMVKSSSHNRYPGELKAHDMLQAAWASIPDSGGVPGIACLNAMASGTGYQQRIGSKIQLKTLRLTLALAPKPDTSTGGQPTKLHFAVIWDRQPPNSATMPLWDSIFKDTAGGSSVWTHPNLEQRERFRVLWEERVLMPEFDVSGSINSSVYPQTDFVYDKFLNLSGLDTMFKATTGELASISTGALYLYVGASTGAVTNYTYHSRLRYED